MKDCRRYLEHEPNKCCFNIDYEQIKNYSTLSNCRGYLADLHGGQDLCVGLGQVQLVLGDVQLFDVVGRVHGHNVLVTGGQRQTNSAAAAAIHSFYMRI